MADSVLDVAPDRGACSRWTAEHLRIARSHGLGPWLCHWLTLHPEAGAPAEILSGLREDYRAATLQGLAREASLLALLESFEAIEVPLVLLKGSYLVRFVYFDAALRPMDDVDVLVHEEHGQRAEKALLNLGYRCAIKTVSPYHRLFKPALPYYRSSPRPEHVDLHWALQAMDYYRFPSAVVWKEAMETRLNGCRVFFLSPESNFIHLGVHTLNHAHAMRNWFDLALLAKKTPLDWDRCASLADRLGVLRVMYWLLRELARYWRIEPPSHVMERIEAYRPRWIEDRVIHHRGRRYWRLYARLERLPAWPSKVDYLLSLVLGRVAGR